MPSIEATWRHHNGHLQGYDGKKDRFSLPIKGGRFHYFISSNLSIYYFEHLITCFGYLHLRTCLTLTVEGAPLEQSPSCRCGGRRRRTGSPLKLVPQGGRRRTGSLLKLVPQGKRSQHLEYSPPARLPAYPAPSESVED